MDFDFEPEEQAPAGHKPQRPRKIRRSDDAPPAGPVPVDGADFFRPSHQEPPPPPAPPRHEEPGRPQHPIQRGLFMLILLVQAALSAAAVIQLYRTRMLPNYYLAILGALLALVWLLFFKCQRYKVRGALTRLLSLALSAAMAVGCVWAQQGLDALDKVTMGDEETDYEAQAITTQPFVVYLSGVDNRGELTEDARSDVNILAVVNPVTKRVALVNTPRDYYVDLAGTDSKDKLTHAGPVWGGDFHADAGRPLRHPGGRVCPDQLCGLHRHRGRFGRHRRLLDTAFTSVGSPGYYDPTDFVEGWNHLDGAAALAFARERHAFATGDIQRGINQMKVIDAMLEKIKSPALLTNYSRLLEAVSDNFVTSLSSGQIAALVRMQLSDFAAWDIDTRSRVGTSSSSTHCYSAQGQKLYVMTPDEASVAAAQAVIQSVLSGEPAPAPEDAGASSAGSGSSQPAA